MTPYPSTKTAEIVNAIHEGHTLRAIAAAHDVSLSYVSKTRRRWVSQTRCRSLPPCSLSLAENCKTRGARVKFLRLATHEIHKPMAWSQLHLGRVAGVGDDVIRKLERCEGAVSSGCVHKICKALGVPVDLLTWPPTRWVRAVRGLSINRSGGMI